MEMVFDMVIHKGVGGYFALTQAVVDKLRVRNKECCSKCPWILDVTKIGEGLYDVPQASKPDDEIKFRRDPVFIAVVQELESELAAKELENYKMIIKNDSRTLIKKLRASLDKMELELLHGLTVTTVHVDIEIEEGCCGDESVKIDGWTD